MNNCNTAKIATAPLDYNICPCCNLLKSVYSFIDPYYFTSYIICNDCRRNNWLSSVSPSQQYNQLYPQNATQNTASNIKKENNKKIPIKPKSFYCIPTSKWSAVSEKRAENMKIVYKAKLVYHRLYKHQSIVSPSSPK